MLMDTLAIRMDVKTYCTAIAAFHRAGDLAGAQRLFDRMIADSSVRPDIVAHRLMFNVYFEHQAWRQVGLGSWSTAAPRLTPRHPGSCHD